MSNRLKKSTRALIKLSKHARTQRMSFTRKQAADDLRYERKKHGAKETRDRLIRLAGYIA